MHLSELCDFWRTHQIWTRSLRRASIFQDIDMLNRNIYVLKYFCAIREESVPKRDIRDPKKLPRHMLSDWGLHWLLSRRAVGISAWNVTMVYCVKTHRVFCERDMAGMGIMRPSEALFVSFRGKTRLCVTTTCPLELGKSRLSHNAFLLDKFSFILEISQFQNSDKGTQGSDRPCWSLWKRVSFIEIHHTRGGVCGPPLEDHSRPDACPQAAHTKGVPGTIERGCTGYGFAALPQLQSPVCCNAHFSG